MRGALFAVLACIAFAAGAAAPAPAARATLESSGLRSIAGWLENEGTPGYLAAEVADAVGIPRQADERLIDALQRGFRDAAVLRLAQSIRGEYLLFMVQAPGEVHFYLSTPRDGLRRALVSVPGHAAVVPLGGEEAESNFRREVLYWETKAAR